MEIEKIVEGDTVTLALKGWLDTQSAPELEAELAEIGSDISSIVFDFKELEYISSSGIRQIVSAYKLMNGNVVLKSVSGEVLEVLNMTGITKRVNVE
ncbi:MAG: STAS domain-containing protein [Oribacterium sp.]|nr:STAS domain-containing protein [Oribacterium sp.]